MIQDKSMTYVFQYGSNMCITRLNKADRLAGDAKFFCIAKTVDLFEFAFTVWSETNDCAAADIITSNVGQHIYGVLYEVPDFLISRASAKANNRKSMDAIEGEGTNYIRKIIELEKLDGSRINALTYVVKERRRDIKTSMHYVQHILDGLKENNIPEEYRRYVVAQIIANNRDLAQMLEVVHLDESHQTLSNQ
ncbi:MAG: gamma-glutamylcyclotransferase family protein [Pseudomonadota bacterium]